MSGGVDSSVAAALLRDAGHEVVGCFMRLGSPGETLDELMPADEACGVGGGGGAREGSGKIKIGHQGCCSINDAADARQVAAQLGIPFYVCNFKRDFGRIINYFVDEYVSGRTPNPCVRCNDWLKFGKLHEYARQIGAEFVASGHYARVEPGPGGAMRLLRGVDHSKDQSYVLFGAPRERLASMLLPIGGMEKSRVRELAKQYGLDVFDKPDSQEICFVPDNDYGRFLEQSRLVHPHRGDIVDTQGRVLGRHEGIEFYTIGQRKGLGISSSHPLYVLELDPAGNRVVVGEESQLLRAEFTVDRCNWIPWDSPPESLECTARIRYNHPGTAATVQPGPDGTARVRLHEPARAVTPGQACVLYDGDRVLGGGWIRREG